MLNKGAQARHSRNIPLRITHPSHSLPLSQAAQHNHFHLPSSSQPEAKTTESKRRKEARDEEGSRRARAAAATTALNHRRPSGPYRQRQEPEGSKAPRSSTTAPRPPGQHHQHTTATIQTQPIWWTFLLVTVYFAFATAISAHGCWVYSKKRLRKADESHGFLNGDVENRDLSTSISGERKRDEMDKKPNYYEQIANEKKAGFWGRCMQIIYQTSAGATMLTDVTFWGLLVPFFYRDKFGFDMVTDGMHSLNAVFLLIDTVLNNMPFPWYRMGFFVFWSCSYVTFQWVLHACGGLSWWPYPFLDLSSSGAPLWYLAMAVAHIPCFFLYWLIVKAKHTYFPRLFPHAYVRTNKSDPSSNYGPYVQ